MSDTPRTDQFEKAYFAGLTTQFEDGFDFARELERENNALRDSHAAIYFALKTQEADHTKWPEQIAALRAAAAIDATREEQK